MTLSEDIKKKIREENKKWLNDYGGKTKEERKKLGQFYTPPKLIIEMIECLDSIDPNEDYLDPCCGNGGILAALLIAGVRPNHIYANELDRPTLLKAYNRLQKLSEELYDERIPLEHFRHCNALEGGAYFEDKFPETFLDKFGRDV